MSKTRKQIRNTVATLLKGKTDAKDNVFPSRITPQDRKDHPLVNVYSTNEIIDGVYSEAPLNLKRDLTIVCEIITSDANNDNNAADQADDIAEQIEQIMFKQEADRKSKLGCLVEKIRLAGVNSEYEYPGDSAVLSLRVAFACTYNKEAVDTEFDNVTDLERIGAQWDVGTANDPDPEAEDVIELNP